MITHSVYNLSPWKVCRSPVCLLVKEIAPAADSLCQRYDHSGKISGENCHDKEKVRRFYKEFPGACAEEFYSDSLSDTPMAEIAQRAYIVRKENLSSWPF